MMGDELRRFGLFSGSIIFSIENLSMQFDRWFRVWLSSESLVSWSMLTGEAAADDAGEDGADDEEDSDDIVVMFKSSESELMASMWSLFAADSMMGLFGLFFVLTGRSAGVKLSICIPRGLCGMGKKEKNEMKIMLFDLFWGVSTES